MTSAPQQLAAVLVQALRSEAPPAIALMRLLMEAPSEAEARTALEAARRSEAMGPGPAERLRAMEALWLGHPAAWSTVRAAVADIAHQHRDPRAAGDARLLGRGLRPAGRDFARGERCLVLVGQPGHPGRRDRRGLRPDGGMGTAGARSRRPRPRLRHRPLSPGAVAAASRHRRPRRLVRDGGRSAAALRRPRQCPHRADLRRRSRTDAGPKPRSGPRGGRLSLPGRDRRRACGAPRRGDRPGVASRADTP